LSDDIATVALHCVYRRCGAGHRSANVKFCHWGSEPAWRCDGGMGEAIGFAFVRVISRANPYEG
jgi:hypothetical protein